MGTGRGRYRRHRRLPHRPWLGPGEAAPRRRGRPGPQRHPRGRIPLRRRRLRPRLLRDLPARGPGHRPAAADRPPGRLGGAGAGRDRPRRAPRRRHRCLRRRRQRRLPSRHRPVRARRDRPVGEPPLRTALLHPRPGGPLRQRRHGLLVVPDRPAPRRAGDPLGRMLARPGRRCHRDVHPGRLRRVRRDGGPLPGRPLQALLRRRRRHRLVRGRGHARRRAPLGGPSARPRGPRGPARLRHQPGRRLQRSHRPQRPLPAARHPQGAGRRRAHRPRGRRRGGTRDRDHPRRPHRGPGPPGDVRAGPARGAAAAARLGQVQHRSQPGRLRRRGHHQDGPRHAARHAAAHPARREALAPRRLGPGRGPPADRGGRLARDRTPAPRRCLLLRRQRHQRARHPGTGPHRPARPGAGHGARHARHRRRTPAAPAAVGGHRGLPDRAGRPAPRPAHRRCGAAAGHRRPGALPGHHPLRLRAPGRPRRGRPRRPPRRAHRPHRGPRPPRRTARPRGPRRPDRVPLPRAGLPASRGGPRPLRPLPGLRHRPRRGPRPLRPGTRTPAARRDVRRRGHPRGGAPRPDRLDPARPVRPRRGPVPAGRVLGRTARPARRALGRRARGRPRGRGPLPAGRLPRRLRPRPPHGGTPGGRRHARRARHRGRDRPVPDRPGLPRRRQRPGVRGGLGRREGGHRARRGARRTGRED